MTGGAQTSDVEARFEPNLEFRRATGRIAGPVAVITGASATSRFGLTVATLTSASDSPPMLMFLASEQSRSAKSILDTGSFGVNVLARGQESICYQFATTTAEKFEGVAVSEFPSGIPLLEGCAFSADCVIEAVQSVGDHVAVFGSVSWFRVAEDSRAPLVFYRSRLARLDAASGRYTPTEPLQWW